MHINTGDPGSFILLVFYLIELLPFLMVQHCVFLSRVAIDQPPTLPPREEVDIFFFFFMFVFLSNPYSLRPIPPVIITTTGNLCSTFTEYMT